MNFKGKMYKHLVANGNLKENVPTVRSIRQQNSLLEQTPWGYGSITHMGVI